MILISVFDKKSATYAAPQPFDHVTSALRAYMAFCRKSPETMQVAFSEDFDLYEVGVFNSVSGILSPTIPPAYLESMINLANASKEVSRG